MFAGPNGSGKSRIKSVLDSELLGVYLNADDIQRAFLAGGFSIERLQLETSNEAISQFWSQASILPPGERENIPELADNIVRLYEPNGYGAAAFTEFLRQELIQARVSFSFETVMSHRSKVDILSEAKRAGYRTYLYFICTEDPEINLARIKTRVSQGGHDVPEEKVRDRYKRSLALLPDAIRHCDRAYIFDNSAADADRVWIAEFQQGREMRLNVPEDRLPSWFRNSVLAWLE